MAEVISLLDSDSDDGQAAGARFALSPQLVPGGPLWLVAGAEVGQAAGGVAATPVGAVQSVDATGQNAVLVVSEVLQLHVEGFRVQRLPCVNSGIGVSVFSTVMKNH